MLARIRPRGKMRRVGMIAEALIHHPAARAIRRGMFVHAHMTRLTTAVWVWRTTADLNFSAQEHCKRSQENGTHGVAHDFRCNILHIHAWYCIIVLLAEC